MPCYGITFLWCKPCKSCPFLCLGTTFSRCPMTVLHMAPHSKLAHALLWIADWVQIDSFEYVFFGFAPSTAWIGSE